MAMTRDQFVTEICDIVGKSESASSVSGAVLQTRVRTYLNWAQKRVARAYSFHELSKYNETAATVADAKRYPMETGTNNFGLIRPKDIHSIRLIDGENSRTLTRWSQRKFDKWYPRPANYATSRPRIYVRWGSDLELFRIPNDAYTLYIRYSQWPTDFSTGAQTSDYTNKDQLLTTMGVFETYLALEEYTDAEIWFAKARGMIMDAVRAEGDVDWEPEAEPHMARPGYESGEPWKDPYGDAYDPLFGYGG